MGIEDLKRWQWALLGIVAGAALGWSWGGVPDQTGVRTFTDVGGRQFRAALRRTDADGGPMARDLLVYPPTEAFEGRATVRLVTFELKRNRGADAAFVPQAYYSPVPFPAAGAGGEDAKEYASVEDFLAEVAGQGRYEQVSYRSAWWAEPAVGMAVGAVGGLVLVGGVWPTVLGLLSGAGLGRPKRAEKEYDLDRFGQGEPAPAAAVAAPASGGDDDIDAVMARYQTGLAGDTAMTDSTAAAMNADGDDNGGGERPVRRLDARPAEPAPPPPKSDDDASREFGGEYYPVAKPAGKPKE